uniref:DX domain-containing protein n=1 Tax=Caenorhabditis japonica TaxID=281687 RepID=A0A8R1I946_CAEJA
MLPIWISLDMTSVWSLHCHWQEKETVRRKLRRLIARTLAQCADAEDVVQNVIVIHPGKPLRPPEYFYTSSYRCNPKELAPPGFVFAYCSPFSSTVTYVGLINKCGEFQHMSANVKCSSSADCASGYVCVRMIEDGICFWDPEDCHKSISSELYSELTFYTLFSVFGAAMCFLMKSCYVYPWLYSKLLRINFPEYDVTAKEMKLLEIIYVRDEKTEEGKEKMRDQFRECLWKDEVKRTEFNAIDYFLKYFGYMVDYQHDLEDDDDLKENVKPTDRDIELEGW